LTSIVKSAQQTAQAAPRDPQKVYVDAPTPGQSEAESAKKLAAVTVIVPVFNEQRSVASTLDDLVALLTATKRPFEILAINDGSTDDTAAVLNRYDESGLVRVLHNAQNRGYGWSLKRAVLAAKHELIAITDADGTYPNNRLVELLDAMEHADMGVGARTGAKVAIPLIRRPAKWFITQLAAYLTGVRIPDLNSGLRVMKKTLIKRFIRLLPDGFSFTTTITLSLLTHGYDVKYIPISYAKRIGKSSIRPIHDTLNFIHLIVRTVLYFKPLKIFAPTGALLMVAAFTVALGSKLIWGEVADVTSVTLAMAAIQTMSIGLLADLIEKRSPAFG